MRIAKSSAQDNIELGYIYYPQMIIGQGFFEHRETPKNINFALTMQQITFAIKFLICI